MIKANELRIGNWLDPAEPEYSGKYFQIKSGDIQHIEQGMPEYKYQPIPLTPSILEKAGFVKGAIGYYWKDDTCVYYANSGLHEYQMHCGGLHLPATSRVQYLHQLQNLYYCLTGHELTINL